LVWEPPRSNDEEEGTMGSAGSERLEELQPESTAQLRRAREAARAEVADPELLELCMGRIDAMLSGTAWSEPEDLSERERAYLDFAEQFSLSVGDVTEAQVEGLLAHDSDEDVCRFVGALYPLEMSRRVELVAAEVLL
jgi:alkylhydroperoxidase family enzyme